MQKSILSITVLALVALFPFSANAQWQASGLNMYLNNGGSVGIGTTTPSELFHVNGPNGALNVSDTGTPGNQMLIQANSVNGPLIASHTNSLGLSTIAAAGAEWIISAYGHVFQTSPVTSVGSPRVWTDRMIIQGASGTPGNIGLGGAITNRTTLAGSSMVIKGGNVGIGTLNPVSPLVVGGTQTGNAGLEISPSSGVSVSAYNRSNDTYTSLSFDGLAESFRFKTPSASAVTFKYVGPTSLNGPLTGVDLDVGTNVTATNFAVTGQKITMPTVTNTDAATRNYYGLQVVPGAIIQNNAAGINNWTGLGVTMPAITQTTGIVTSTGIKITGGTVNSGTSYALTTDAAAGNVGIGTTTPTAKLDVNGNIKLSGNIISDGDICIGVCQ